MNYLLKDINNIKAQLQDLRAAYTEIAKIVQGLTGGEKKAPEPKMKQLNYVFFVEELEKYIVQLEGCDKVNLYINESVITQIRLINSTTIKSKNVDVELEVTFPISLPNGNVLLKRLGKNSYSQLSGDVKVLLNCQ